MHLHPVKFTEHGITVTDRQRYFQWMPMQSDQNGLLPQLMLRCALSCVVFDCNVSARCLMLRLIVVLVCSALCCF